jgi:uncharacterized protein
MDDGRGILVMAAKMKLTVILGLLVCFLVPWNTGMAQSSAKKLIYDEAGLLSREQLVELEAMANQLGPVRETDIMIYTSRNSANADVMRMTQDFYDDNAPGFDKPHGNAVILTLDMRNREVYLAGFYKAKEYLDDSRLDKIRSRITPDLSNGDYGSAFRKYIQTAYDYMEYPPGVNPDNILFQTWFQAAASLGIAAVIVGMMAYHSGGRVTVRRQTYEDASTSGVVRHHDQYIRTTVSKRHIPKSTGGGGGGGGTTGGGHSHSGSRGSF